jgi:ABC-type transport system substrate-binding protein
MRSGMHTPTTSGQAPRRAWKRSRERRAGVSLVALSVVLFMAGCAAQSSPPLAQQTLRIGARDSVETPRVLRDLLYAEPLFALDWKGRPAERLATHWAWEGNGRALRVTLRPGVKFHDGDPLTSAAVAAILRAEMANLKGRGFESVVGLDTPDERTLLFRLSRPDAFLIDILAGTLIVDPKKPDIGTGPFRIVKTTPVLEAEKYVGYYRGTPGIDHIRLLVFETQRAAWAALMRGDVDMVQEVNRESVEFLQRDSDVALYPSVRPFYIPLVFNVRHPILKRVEVRRALAEAIDRDEIVQKGMHGQGKVADDPLWPSHWAYNPGASRHTYNPASARRRLEAAGLPVKPGAAPGAMASRFRIQCVFWSEDPQFERIALLLQRQLAEIDVELSLEKADEKSLVARITKGNFDTYLFQMTSGRSFQLLYRIWHSPPAGTKVGIQDSGYRGVDAILERLRNSLSIPEIQTGAADLRQQFYEDVPAAFLAWPENTRAVDVRYDVGDRTDPEIWANLWRWRPAERRQAAR